MNYDVVIVGAGPAGLSAAIRLKQMSLQKNQDISVWLLEKGSEVGAHIVSGSCVNPSSLRILFPEFQKDDSWPLKTEVTEDSFKILFSKGHIKIPTMFLPNAMHNNGNYLVGLGEFTKWLGGKAEELGVDVLPGFAADKIYYNDDGSVGGVITNDFGIAKDGTKKDNYSPGVIVKGKQTIFSEGARGSLSQKIIKQFKLDENIVNKQQYGIGFKEIWEVDNKYFKPGLVIHTVNWPVGSQAYGGSFMYHSKPNRILVGMIIGLDYKDPYFNPYEEFQLFKTHKEVKKYLENGKWVSYGAKALNEGGYHSIPKLTFKGGMLAGWSAGFLNVAEIKGTHHSMKSGIIAADTILKEIEQGKDISKQELIEYEKSVHESSNVNELRKWRNLKLGFKNSLWLGMIHAFLLRFTKGREPWTLKLKNTDSESTGFKKDYKPKEYPKKDGKLTFDLLTNLVRTGTNHDHNQPSHLKIREGMEEWIEKSYEIYGAPEDRFCPAKVYEHILDEQTGKVKLHINSQNWIHCKTWDIKTPKNYIEWNVPQGGEGPKYSEM